MKVYTVNQAWTIDEDPSRYHTEHTVLAVFVTYEKAVEFVKNYFPYSTFRKEDITDEFIEQEWEEASTDEKAYYSNDISVFRKDYESLILKNDIFDPDKVRRSFEIDSIFSYHNGKYKLNIQEYDAE